MRFFRPFRNQLAERGPLTRYALYALGEIVLLVIGILLALQIDNWNEKRKNAAMNRIMLQQLQEENRTNIAGLMEDKALQDTIVTTMTDFMDFLRQDVVPLDSLQLRIYLASLANSTSYTFSENYLLSYINANQQEQTELSRQLSELHSNQTDLHYISEKGLENRLENFFQYLEETVDFYDLSITDYTIFSTLKFRNRIALIRALEVEKNRQYFRTLRQEQKVDSLISNYLGLGSPSPS